MNTRFTTAGNNHTMATLIKKMMLCQFGAAMLGIMISVPTAEPNIYLDLATSFFAMAFYVYILYTSVWDVAAKDKLAIDGGRMKEDRFKGLKSALLANIPTYTLAIVIIGGRAINGAFGSEWAASMAGICSSCELFWNSMYLGFLNLLNPGANVGNWALIRFSLLFFVITLPALITCHLAYRAGLRGFRVFPERKKNN